VHSKSIEIITQKYNVIKFDTNFWLVIALNSKINKFKKWINAESRLYKSIIIADLISVE